MLEKAAKQNLVKKGRKKEGGENLTLNRIINVPIGFGDGLILRSRTC